MVGAIETRSAPTLLGATHRAFTFYLGNPISSIETRSLPSLTHVLPRIRPVGFPIYVAPLGGSIHSPLPVAAWPSISPIPSAQLKLVRLPLSLAATLATLPSISLIPRLD